MGQEKEHWDVTSGFFRESGTQAEKEINFDLGASM